MARFMPSQDDYKAEIFAIAGWCVWNRRNAIHFNQAFRPIDSICREVGNILQEFIQAREVELSPPRPLVAQQWRPPNLNVYKINFDAAIFRASNLASVGVIVRDNQGTLKATVSKQNLKEQITIRERCEITIWIGGVSVGQRGHQPWRRGDSVNEDFGSEVLVEDKGLVLGLVDDQPFPIKDLRQ
ncbi:hypothetical protein CFP56_034038 [Quercus suber]|uniref:RNase H type-1 domain-containing protein n=1 Tax=Quercus suber TaxID=58331 RepID=A0AAW0JDQ1_QUESU